MGESSSDDSSAAEEEQGIAGELDRSDVADVSNISNDNNYDAQFTADNLQDRGLDPQGFMSPENFAQTTQGGAPDPYALDDGFYDSVSSVANQVVANLPTVATSPVAQVAMQNIPDFNQQQNLNQMSFIPQGALDTNYNMNFTPAVDLSFPQRIGNMFSRQYLGENLFEQIPSRLDVTEAPRNFSPVRFTPDFATTSTTASTTDKDNEELAELAAKQAFTGAQVDDFARANLGQLPTPSGAGTAPITMTNDPNLDNFNSDFNISGSNAAEGLRNRAAPTSGILPVVDAILGFPAQNQLNRLDQGFVPRFDNGEIVGTRDFSFGSNQTEGLLGQNPLLTNIYGANQDNTSMMSDSGDDNETVPPVTNPLTGVTRCPEGYKFDEDLQACRVDTGTKKKADDKTPSGERFFRQTLLDTAPSNLPSGFDFDAANKRFTSGFAVNPSNFNRPPSLTGFTPFSGFRPFS